MSNYEHIYYLSTSTLISDSANAVHVMKMCSALAGQKHKVTLYALRGGGSDQDVFEYYGVPNSFSIRRLSEDDFWLSRWLWKLRAKVACLKVGGLPSVLFARFFLRCQAPTVQNLLLFARNRYWLMGMSESTDFILESHTPPQSRIDYWIERTLLNRTSCKGIIVISNAMRDIYASMYPELTDKLIVAPDAADDPHSGEREVKVRQKLGHIGYVGHLYKGRGIELIIQLARRFPNIRFSLVGGTPEHVAHYRKDPKVPENVQFLGHQPHSQLSHFYSKFDAVLAPYQKKVAVAGDTGDTSVFMSPLKIFEYMSWGLPIICSDMPVLREVLRDNDNALLVAADKLEDWSQAIEKLASHPKLRQEISRRARSDFIDKYTWSGRVRHIIESV